MPEKLNAFDEAVMKGSFADSASFVVNTLFGLL